MTNSLDAIYEVPPTSIDDFRRDGFVYLRGLLPAPEVEHYRESIARAVSRLNEETRPIAERDTYAKAFLQTMNLWRHDDEIKKFVFAKRFASVAAQLLGVEAVRLYHDQALFKERGGGHTPWHQDQYYWPLSTDRTITMWMALTDVTPEMGPVRFVTASHTSGALSSVGISDESDLSFGKIIKERGFTIAPLPTLHAGDVSFHAGWTLHGAPPNYTDRMREAMTIIYFADGARATEPDNENRKADLTSWLPGIQPGELAASEINPVLYRTASASVHSK